MTHWLALVFWSFSKSQLIWLSSSIWIDSFGSHLRFWPGTVLLIAECFLYAIKHQLETEDSWTKFFVQKKRSKKLIKFWTQFIRWWSNAPISECSFLLFTLRFKPVSVFFISLVHPQIQVQLYLNGVTLVSASRHKSQWDNQDKKN